MRENFEEEEPKEEKTEQAKEPAWYEKKTDGSAWFENLSAEPSPSEENKSEPSAVKTEKNEPAESAPENISETNEESGLCEASVGQEPETDGEENPKKTEAETDGDREKDSGEGDLPFDWEEYNKVYLPDPPPEFLTDTIKNPREYIEQNFAGNEAVWKFRRESVKKSTSLAVSLIGLALISALVTFRCWTLSPAFGIIALVATVSVGLLMITISQRKRKVYTKKLSDFELIKPYAVKKEFGDGRLGPDPAADEDEGIDADLKEAQEKLRYVTPDCGLKLYYERDGIQREAETEQIYSEKQADALIEAFLAGKLIVACLKSDFWGDKAVICSPDLIE